MTTCNNCKGDGLVGAGENPHLKEGPVSTCTVCNGTGKVEVATPAPIETSSPEVPTPEPEKKTEDSLENSGTNTVSTPTDDSSSTVS